MRFNLVLLLVWLSAALSSSAFAQDTAAVAPTPLPLNILTFNLRYNNPADGRNAWPNRKQRVAQVLTDGQIDFAGMQEALAGMIDDLQGLLPQYAWIGVGRDDGRRAGEFSPIFYLREKFAPERHGTFWLSETPETVGSKSWDAALPRIATWGVFRELRTGRRVFVMNTHFDHRGELARRRSAALLVERLAALSENLPVVLTGDFNSPENTAAYQTVVNNARYKLFDTKAISQTPHEGGADTFNDFRANPRDLVIDFIFVGAGIQAKSHRYLSGDVREGVFVSDHWPVMSQIVVP